MWEPSMHGKGCGGTKRYKGKRQPRCCGGLGCWPCWGKFLLVNPTWGEDWE